MKHPKSTLRSVHAVAELLPEPRVNQRALLRSTIVFTIATVSSWAHAETGNPFEDFKAFVASPPPIREVRYVHYYPGKTNQSPPVFTLATWQSNAFLRIITDRQENLLDSGWTNQKALIKADCRSANFWWKLEGANRELMVWDADANATSSGNSVDSSVDASLRDFASFVLMGIQHTKLGSIHWVGNAFELTNKIGAAEWRLAGELTPNVNGKAGKLDLHLGLLEKEFTEPRRWHWNIQYSYDELLPLPFLPNRITTELLENGTQRTLDEYDILSLTLEDAPALASVFEPNQYVFSNSLVYYVSNKTIVHFLEGTWQERMKPNDKRILVDRPARPGMKIVYMLVAILLFAPLVGLLKRRTRERSAS